MEIAEKYGDGGPLKQYVEQVLREGDGENGGSGRNLRMQ